MSFLRANSDCLCLWIWLGPFRYDPVEPTCEDRHEVSTSTNRFAEGLNDYRLSLAKRRSIKAHVGNTGKQMCYAFKGKFCRYARSHTRVGSHEEYEYGL